MRKQEHEPQQETIAIEAKEIIDLTAKKRNKEIAVNAKSYLIVQI